MNRFVSEFFVATTGEDQANYFSQEVYFVPGTGTEEKSPLPRGTYRVIDGNLCQLLSGLDLDDVRARLRATT